MLKNQIKKHEDSQKKREPKSQSTSSVGHNPQTFLASRTSINSDENNPLLPKPEPKSEKKEKKSLLCSYLLDPLNLSCKNNYYIQNSPYFPLTTAVVAVL